MSTNSKVWFITGASSGFGRSLMQEALRRGDRVVAAARKTAELDALAKTSEGRLLPLRLDVKSGDDVRSAVRAALERFGQVDVLVNNAGYGIVGAVEETGDHELRTVMETMFFGAVALTRELLPSMRARKTGTIVQITSMGGLTTAPGFGAYCAAKHALEGLSECLSAEVAPLGLRVLIVEPGAFRTSLFGGGLQAMPELAPYAATVGPTRGYTQQSHGAQEGDPDKAARAIADAVDAGSPTLRLPLGGDAVDGIRKKLAAVGADVDKNERAARATTF